MKRLLIVNLQKKLLDLVMILGINFLIYGLAQYLGLARVWINIDYVIVALCAISRFKWAYYPLWIMVFLSDLCLCLAQIFPFFRLSDILYILKFVLISSFYYQLACIAILGIICLNVWLNYKRHLDKHLLYSLLLVCSIGFCIQSIFVQKQHIFSSQAVEFVSLQFEGFHQAVNQNSEQLQLLKQPSIAVQQLEQRINIDKNPPNVLFIVAESLGALKNLETQNAVIAPLLKSEKIKNLQLDKASYVSATVQAELRELCQAEAKNFNLKDLQTGFENCLAQQFKQRGYMTTAMHGALGIMYDRKSWYPRAGFDQIIFRDTQQWKTRCYSFPGICDRELAAQVAAQFKQPQPQFFYWLTLNTHAIYDLRDLHQDGFDCVQYGVKSETETCRNLKLHWQFFHTLAQLLEQPQMENSIVIVVGDHTPAILDQIEKTEYFDENNVLILSFQTQS